MQLSGSPCCAQAVHIVAAMLGQKLATSEDSCGCGQLALRDGSVEVRYAPAIARYLARKFQARLNLLGSGPEEEAKVDQFCCAADRMGALSAVAIGTVFNSDLQPRFHQPAHEAACNDIYGMLQCLNGHLQTRTFLVGERVSLADLLMFSIASKVLAKMVMKDTGSETYQNLVRWANTVGAIDAVKKQVKSVEFASEPLPDHPVTCTTSAKGGKDEADDEPVDEVPEPVVPAYTFDMYAWKKHYKNLNWDAGAHWEPYFWEHYKPEEFTLYLCTYQYPEYLTEGLKAKNMIIVWLQKLRAEKADKHTFGNVLVTKVESEKTYRVVAVFMFPGKNTVPAEILEAMGTASYKFEPLEDPDDPATRKLISQVWNWEESEDIVFRGANFGKTYDGETWH